MQHTALRPRTIRLLARLIKPWTEEGIIFVAEEQEIIANLRSLASKGHLLPEINPRLIDQREAAEMLGLGHSNFRKMERADAFPFKRRMIGSSVRFLNLDLIKYMLATDDQTIAVTDN